MPNRSYTKIQEALDALTGVERNLNELKYYRSCLLSPNHSASACSSVYNKIGTLQTKHTALVNALFTYGRSLGAMEAALAASNNSEYENTKAPQFYYTSAPEHQKSGWEKFWEQIILGEFSEETTWEGLAGNIGVSLVAGFFGVDAPLDIRDALGNISKGEYGAALLDCVFLLPIIGAFKPAKYADEVVDVIKYGDEAVEIGSTIIKNSDNVVQSVYKSGDNVFGFTDGVFDGIKNADNIAITHSGEKLLWTTSNGRNYILSDDTLQIVNKSGAVDSSVSGVKVLPNFSYVKKSEKQLDELRKAFDTTERSSFLKKLATDNYDDLKKLNLSDAQIEKIKNGKVPVGFEVHHKLSLDDGGSNDFENLILIEDKYHDVFTFYQNTFTKTEIFNQQGYMVVDWIFPTGNVYIPK